MTTRLSKAGTSVRWFEDIESASRLIMPDVLARERELNAIKWFDYPMGCLAHRNVSRLINPT